MLLRYFHIICEICSLILSLLKNLFYNKELGNIPRLSPNYDNFAILTIRTESLTLPILVLQTVSHRPFYYLCTQKLDSKIVNVNRGIHIPVVMCSTLRTSPTSNSQILNRLVLVTTHVTSLT